MPAPVIPVAVKVGKEVVKHRKILWKIIIGLVGGFFVLTTVVTTALKPMSAFVGESLDSDMVVEEAPIFLQSEKAWNKYLEELTERMDAEEERLIEEYAEKGEEVEIIRNYNNINYAYITAYLSWVNDDFASAKTREDVVYDEDMIDNFINELSTLYRRTIPVSVQAQASEGIEYTEEEIEAMTTKVVLYNRIESPSVAAQILADQYPQYDDFYDNYLFSFQEHCAYFGIENVYTDGMWTDGVAIDYMGSTVTSNIFSDVPIYNQQDYSQPYGSGTIASGGCGPTCVAMVFSYLLSQDLTPDKVVDWTGDTYYAYDENGNGLGSAWSLFPGCATHWGLNCTELGINKDAILSELEQGHIIIASMGPHTFTSKGHFIVLTGTIEGNMFKIHDPNKYNFEKYRTRYFDCNTVLNEAKNFWSFY